MEQLSLKEIAAALGADCPADAVVDGICIDTREVRKGSLFTAIKGERFDGHDFIPKAFELGAAAVIASRPVPGMRGPVLLVEDTRKAFLDLSGWYRRRFGVKVAAVTGSVGKTSTKEMIDAVLSSRFKTLKTEGNLNNEIGLPKTLFRLDRSYQAAVIEMGMSGFGEISRLSRAAQGDLGVITNIGVSHIEKLGSRENILKAKLEILDGLKESAPLIVNADDDLLQGLALDGRRIVRYGISSAEAEPRAVKIRTEKLETVFEICYRGEEYPARIPVLGNHHVLNALAAFAAGIELGMSPEEVTEALPGYQPSGMRQKTVDFHGIIVVEDCYNASPDSMKASLSVLSMLGNGGKRVAVLGDMLELGDYSEEAHRQVGRMAAENRLDAVACLGEASAFTAQEALRNGVPCVRCFERKEDAAGWLKRSLLPGDAVLFKASRGMKFEEIISAFYGEE
ncbi:MAG: UDP-N-acetylmuramoyl-tripeptide--D-alanyl-D-alanine ligase [Oscillospiraceae bacterium]|nr:UDP-N-acetylmuramoyl-tripeptide--D-alanyl-D-alanine ligase [Oscillospiraceae bacterium]